MIGRSIDTPTLLCEASVPQGSDSKIELLLADLDTGGAHVLCSAHATGNTVSDIDLRGGSSVLAVAASVHPTTKQ